VQPVTATFGNKLPCERSEKLVQIKIASSIAAKSLAEGHANFFSGVTLVRRQRSDPTETPDAVVFVASQTSQGIIGIIVPENNW
jgi:hypothetical protein